MNATYDTLEAIADECQQMGSQGPEYYWKMIHTVPEAPVVKRVDYLLEQAKDKTVLNLGCIGPFHQELVKVATRVYGIDKESVKATELCFQVDLDTEARIPQVPGVDLMIAGEILEHLCNPGNFLRRLHQFACPLIVTVPNAFAQSHPKNLNRQIENVNIDHVAYYSYWTLLRLLEKCGYSLVDWCWYNGKPLFAEGLIMKALHGQTEEKPTQ